MHSVLKCATFMLAGLWSHYADLVAKPHVQVQSSHSFESVITKKIGYRYLQFLPKDYDKDTRKHWPLMLFLHGAGERGDDLEKVKIHGPPKLVSSQPDFPFVLISPQCPENEVWDPDVLLVLLDEIQQRLRIDDKRIYVTGLSMGGFGTWNLIAKAPERFAAAAPVCGGGSTRDFILPRSEEAVRSLPIWAFHGARDEVVLSEESIRLVDWIRNRIKGDVSLTIYPEAGHDAWTATYSNSKLYEWMLSHARQ